MDVVFCYAAWNILPRIKQLRLLKESKNSLNNWLRINSGYVSLCLITRGPYSQANLQNYVVQYVLGNGRPHDRSGVISAMTTKFVKFARHKYASNVCEKALVASTAAERQVLIEELLKPLGENNAEGEETARSSISLLMKDQYGNYVVQKAMNVVAGEQKARLYTAVRSAAQATRSDPEGPTKNVQACESSPL